MITEFVELVSTVAGLLGYSVRDLVASLELRSRTRAGGDGEIVKEELARNSSLVAKYGLLRRTAVGLYPRTELQQANLVSPRVHIEGGSVIETGMVGRPEWIDVSVAVGSDAEKCRASQSSAPRYNAPETAVVDLLERIQLLGLQVFNRPIYRLMSVDLKRNVLDCSFDEEMFFTHRFSEGLVIDELAHALAKSNRDVGAVIRNSSSLLPIRTQVLPDASSFLTLSKRICAGGITMLFAMKNPAGGYEFAVQRRSAVVADGHGMLTVVPRAFHQAMIDRFRELRPSFSALREIYEELLGGEEVERGTRNIRHDFFLNDLPMRWFQENTSEYTFEYTSLGLDLVSGNYSFGMLLAIHDPNFWTQYSSLMKYNWESEERGCWFRSTNDEDAFVQLIGDTSWTGEGIFALVQGLRRLGELDQESTKISKLVRIEL